MKIFYCGVPPSKFKCKVQKRQYGFVLIIALIVLGAMSLAAVSLVRTVDTSTLLSRNISFKRDAIARNDIAMEAALHKFRKDSAYYSVNGLVAGLEIDNVDNNYSALMLATDTQGVPTILKVSNFSSTWNATAIDLGESTIAYYLIERLCTNNNAAEPMPRRCIMGSRIEAGGSQPNQRPGSNVPALFRVTTKVTGPRNTISYAQSVFTLTVSD